MSKVQYRLVPLAGVFTFMSRAEAVRATVAAAGHTRPRGHVEAPGLAANIPCSGTRCTVVLASGG